MLCNPPLPLSFSLVQALLTSCHNYSPFVNTAAQPYLIIGDRRRKLLGKDGCVLHLQLACGSVFLFDSVNGDGSSVKALSKAIYGQVIQLPMMFEQIPVLWASVQKIVQQSYTERVGPLAGRLVLRRREVITLLQPAVPGLNGESLWEALMFWATLGDLVVSGDVLVTDVQTFRMLLRPILQHSLTESLIPGP